MRKNDGGTAFPLVSEDWNHEPGMSLRDYFAAAALQGLLAKGTWGEKYSALCAYKMADAMLVERAKGE